MTTIPLRTYKDGIWGEEDLLLLQQYDRIFQTLKSRHKIRTAHFISDLGEHIACEILGLRLNDNSHLKGYDATDKEKKKYEIKTRRDNYSKPGKIIVSEEQLATADFIVYVEFDKNWSTILYLLPMEYVRGIIGSNNSSKFIRFNKKIKEQWKFAGYQVVPAQS